MTRQIIYITTVLHSQQKHHTPSNVISHLITLNAYHFQAQNLQLQGIQNFKVTITLPRTQRNFDISLVRSNRPISAVKFGYISDRNKLCLLQGTHQRLLSFLTQNKQVYEWSLSLCRCPYSCVFSSVWAQWQDSWNFAWFCSTRDHFNLVFFNLLSSTAWWRKKLQIWSAMY